jgi:alkyldihydroxyacetonephosphate synthase
MEATVRNGGTVSHHHGIGKVRSAWLTEELGETGVDVLRKIKAALDPESVLNPNTLLPPG